jgi:hypothetical protein
MSHDRGEMITAKAVKEEIAPRKKTVSKKKARRYAEQDEEDRELAMLALGHIKLTEQKKEKDKKVIGFSL